LIEISAENELNLFEPPLNPLLEKGGEIDPKNSAYSSELP
jgi:hypothetical protein